MSKVILTIALILSFCGSISASTPEINNIFESVAKVKNGRTYGTSNCINIDDKNVYMITNYHVAGDIGNKVDLFFYRAGHQSQQIKASVVWTAYVRNQPIDISLLAVPLSAFPKDWKPTVINFEYGDSPLKEGDTCLTIGCPEAEWPKANSGHIVSISGGTYKITPIVIEGQSGSVLFNGDGTKAIGLIAWRDDTYGKAMTASTIQKAVLGQQSNYYYKQPYNDLGDRPLIPFYYGDSTVAFGGRRPNNDCPNCRPGPREPRRKQPNNDETTPNDESQPNPKEDGDGIKIFPTYPGKPEDEFNDKAPVAPNDATKPKAAIPPQKSDLDQFKIDNTAKLDGFDGRLKKVEDAITKQTETIKQYEQNNQSLSSSLTDIQNKLAKVPTKEDFVTPGKLNELVKPQIDSVSTDFNKKLEDYSSKIGLNIEHNTVTPGKLTDLLAPIKKDAVDLSQNLGKMGDTVNGLKQAYTEVKSVATQASAQVSSVQNSKEINNTFTKEIIREVVGDKNMDRYINIGGSSIPILVFGAIAYWYRRHFGGAAPDPFRQVKK